MRRRTVLQPRVAMVSALAALAFPAFVYATALAMSMASGPARTTQATISADGFSPTKVTVLTGDTVTWRDIGGTHTVTSVTGAFGSGMLGFNDTFSHRFVTTGTFPYYCTIHRYMVGEVDVADILLDPVSSLAAPNQPLTLHGRAAVASGSQLTVQADDGAGFTGVTTATVADDGTFTATVSPKATTTYRVISGGMKSAAVRVPVLDHKVTIKVARRGKRELVQVSVQPAAPGATVVLQLNLRERFGWWPVQQKRLDGSSRTSFLVRPPYRAPARVVLTLPDGATQLAVSTSLRIRP